MGVHATFCQLCGLPTQHDHYVQGHGLLNIYRGSSPDGGHDWASEPNPPFPFTPEHAWLRDAVGVLTQDEGTVRGQVEDGGLRASEDEDELYVGDGCEDAIVYHHACWERLGRPTTESDAVRGIGGLAWAQLAPYQQQLFEFLEFAAHGKGVWLQPPDRTPEGRQRLERLVEKARRRGHGGQAASLADLVRFDDDWVGTVAMGDDGETATHHVQYRRGVSEFLTLSTHPHLFRATRHFGGDGLPAPASWPRLDALALELQASLEGDGLGVSVLHSVGQGQWQSMAYVTDLAEAHRRYEALGWATVAGTTEYTDAHDPGWDVFFKELAVRAR